MPDYIELNYISPVSKYNFKKGGIYILVLINTSSDNKINIYKTTIKNLDNVNNKTSGYSIKKSIITLPSLLHQSYCIKLFNYDTNTNKIGLIFSGLMHLDKLEMGNYNYVEMNRTPDVLGHLRSATHVDDQSFLEEQFYNFEELETDEKCFLFLRRLAVSGKDVMKPTKISFDYDHSIWLYDRYSNLVVKEFIPDEVGNLKNMSNPEIQYLHSNYFANVFCRMNNYKSYLKFLDKYQRDDRYLMGKNKNDTLKTAISKRIAYGRRPKYYHPYINSIILSPTDGRVRGFNINPTLKISSHNRIYTTKTLVDKPFQLNGGSGFLTRVCPQDYQRVHVPYSAYLREIGIYGGNNNNPLIVKLRFESSYFIPSGVHQRDLLSVIYGNFMYGGVGVGAGLRYWPELLEPQPNTHLIYHVIIITQPLSNSFLFTNKKLRGIRNIIGSNNNYRIKPYWYEQGEEIGKLTCGMASIIVLVNRPIDFTSDIKYYSKMLEKTPLNKPIDTFIKAKDITGILN